MTEDRTDICYMCDVTKAHPKGSGLCVECVGVCATKAVQNLLDAGSEIDRAFRDLREVAGYDKVLSSTMNHYVKAYMEAKSRLPLAGKLV